MNEKILLIRWETGSMKICMDNFFPCSFQKLNKLLKIINLDWQHEAELKEELKSYFQNARAEHEELKKVDAKQHLYYKQKEADTKQVVSTKKHPNGVPLKKEELQAEREQLREYKMLARKHLSGFKRHEKKENWFCETVKLL